MALAATTTIVVVVEANAGKNRGLIDFLQRIALPTGAVAQKSKKIFLYYSYCQKLWSLQATQHRFHAFLAPYSAASRGRSSTIK